MRSIFERLGRYFGSLTKRGFERTPGERTEPPPPFEETRGIRTAPGDPYAEMRKALALTMLLG